jgi:hypothetical protein
MGYLHILNLYKDQKILNFKRCYALEKVHGTSAHIEYDATVGRVPITFYSGGEKHERFVNLFDQENLLKVFQEMGHEKVTVYGEAYGGSQQKMGHTYGPDLKFIVFDVQVGDCWLNVPNMDQVATRLGLEVVPWEETSTELDALNALRDKPSEVAIRRGMGNDKQREGVVLRPLEEMTVNNDHRVIVKHKIDKFGERATPQQVHNVDPNKLVVLAEAKAIANEWVTEERLSHVVGKLTVDGIEPDIKQTGAVIKAMVEDVYREAAGEIVESKEASSAITARTALLFKQRLQKSINNE